MQTYQLFETPHYKVSLYNQGQLYLGRQVVTMKARRSSLSEVTAEEWADFGRVVKKIEDVVKETFGAEYFNWGCFINDAYKSENPEPQVHWHVRPRYRNPVTFADIEFVDEAFGSQFLRKDKEVLLNAVQLEKIYEVLYASYN